MENKLAKRIVIIAVYIILLILVIYGLYSFMKPKETCTDKIRNQNEEDVDCGGVCAPCKKIEVQPLTVGETGIVPSGVSGRYDFYGIVNNPNNLYGSNKFNFQILFKDAAGNNLAEKNGTSFILPGESKYIIETDIGASEQPSSVQLTLNATEWTQFNDYYQKPDLQIVNKNYNEISSGVGFIEAKGLLKNQSPFDFNSIKIKVILKDSAGKIIALNSTQMNTVRSGEERDFRAFWPNRFPGSVQNIETQVEVNALDSDAFAAKFFVPQKFQQITP